MPTIKRSAKCAKTAGKAAAVLLLALLLTVQLAMPAFASSAGPAAETGEATPLEAPEQDIPEDEPADDPAGEPDDPEPLPDPEEPGEPGVVPDPEADDELLGAEGEPEDELGAQADEALAVNIATLEELVQFAEDWNAATDNKFDGKLVTVTLTADIYGPNDIHETNWGPWTPIGTSLRPFTGIFDGAGYMIHGLTVCNTFSDTYPDRGASFGIFGYVKGDFNGTTATRGIIKNLLVARFDSDYIEADYKGALVGHMEQGYITNVGFMDLPETYSAWNVNDLEDGMSMGVLAGYAENSLIEKSFAYGSMIYNVSGPEEGFMAVGGLVGYAVSTDEDIPMIIRDSYFSGQVLGSHGGGPADSGATGGIVGKLDASAGSSASGVFRCYTGMEASAVYNDYSHADMLLTHGGDRGSLGGIVGEVNGGQVKNNISMANGAFLRGVGGESTTADAIITDVHRIVGKNIGGAIEGNYAFDGFTACYRENVSPWAYIEVPLSIDATLDGTGVTGRQLRSGGVDGIAEIWQSTFGTDAWYFATGKAPVLKGMPACAAQTGELPAYLVSPADIDFFSAEEVSIGTAADLAEMAAYLNSGTTYSSSLTGVRGMQSQKVTLTADIDLSPYPDWSPIGKLYSSSPGFEGFFDGNGKTISNLSTGVNSGSAGHVLNAYYRLRGLFGGIDAGWNDGVNGTEHTEDVGVHNLTLKNPQVCMPAGNEAAYKESANSYEIFAAGALAGQASDWNDYKTAVKNVAVISTYGAGGNTTGARVWAEGRAYGVGGLVGSLEGRGNSHGEEENYVMENSYFVGAVDGGAYAYSVGGIVGKMGHGTLIDNCFVAPDGAGREIKGPGFAGGIAGHTYGEDPSNPLNSGSQSYAVIKNCYVASDVRGGTKVGGLIGGVGLLGQSVHANLVLGNVYGTGTDPKTSHVGGLIGGWAYHKTSYGAGAGGNFVMSKEITSAAGVGTVGRNYGPDFHYSSDYAFIGTLVNGYTAVNYADMQGYGQKDTWIKKASNWASRFTYTGYDSPESKAADHWELADGKLPVLKNMPAGYTQSTAIPAHVKDIPEATGFTIDKSHYDFTLEKELDAKILYVWYKPSPATSVLPSLEVTTSNDAIRFSDDSCDFRGFKEGESNTATISVTAKFSGGNQTKSFTVAIDEQIPEVATLYIYGATLQAKRNHQFTPTKTPSRAKLTGAEWTSDNEAIATVDQNGLVTGVAAGEANITVTMPAEVNGGTEVSKTAKVTVKDYVAMDSFAFESKPTTMDEYDYESIYLNFGPEGVYLNGSDIKITTSPEGIISAASSYVDNTNRRATVNLNSSDKTGSVVVTATVNDNGTVKTDSFTVKVGTPVALTGLTLPATATVAKGASQSLAVTPKPANAALPGDLALEIVAGSAKDLDGKATSATIVSVSGTTVTGVNPGTVKVKAKGGGKTSGECTITVPAVLEAITISPPSAALKVGAAPRQLGVVAATPHAALPNDASVTWRVVEEKDEANTATTGVVSLGSDGEVTALKLGSSTIEASLTGSGITGALTAQATVTVRDGITDVYFTEKDGGGRIFSLMLDAAGDHDLADYLSVQADDDVQVVFTAIKSVLDKDGKVLAKTPRAFTAAVTVTDNTDPENPEKFTASLAVKLVTGLEGVALSGAENRTLKVGKSVTLKVTYTPADVSLKSVVWSSGNPAVATVDQAGKVTAVAPGKAVVSAKVTPYAMAGTAADTFITRSYTITVPATAVEILHTANGGIPLPEAAQATGKTLPLVPAGYEDKAETDGADETKWVNFNTLTLKAGALTEDTANAESITWSSSDKNQKVVALAEGANGAATVTGVGTGTATLTATAANGAKATVKVKVGVPVRGITLAFKDAAADTTSDVLVGKTRTLVPAFNAGFDAEPAKADKAVEWRILSGGEYITLSAGGAVKGIAPGVAEVQATSKLDGRRVATKTLTVLAPATSAKLNQKPFAMPVGAERTLSATINGGGAHSPLRPDDSAAYTTYAWEVDGGLTFKDSGNGSPGATSTLATPVLSSVGVASGTTANVRLTVTSGGKALKALAVKVTVDDSYTAVSSLAITKDASLPGEGEEGRKQLYAGGNFTPKLVFNDGTKPAPSNQNISWTVTTSDGSDWTKYISLDETTGKITARLGTQNTSLTVRATAGDDSEKYDEFKFKIWQRATAVSIVKDNGVGNGFNPDLDETYTGTVTLQVGETLRVWGRAIPDVTSDNAVKWAGNGAIVSLTDVGSNAAPAAGGTNFPVVIEAKKAGTVTVSATAVDGSKKKASFKIKVVQQVNDIAITNTDGTQVTGTVGGESHTYAPVTVPGGKAVTLKAKLNAANDKNEATKKLVNQPAPTDKKVTWMVLGQWDAAGTQVESGIITLKNGKVTGLAKGTALVRVVPAGYEASYAKNNVKMYGNYNKTTKTFPEGLYGNTVLVTVNVPAAKVAIQQTKLAMRTGAENAITLNALTTPAQSLLSAAEEPVTWTASPAGIVQFAPVGTGHSVTVTGLAPGKVKLTATTASGKSSKTVEITVDDSAKLIENFDLVKDATWVLRGKSETLKVTVNAGFGANKKAIAPGNPNLRWRVTEYNWDNTPVTADKVGTVATVDQKGKVTVKGDGYAVVTVEAVENPAVWNDSCTVYCQPKL